MKSLLFVSLFLLENIIFADVQGTVFDQDTLPLSGVQIHLKQKGFSESTDSTGSFFIFSKEVKLVPLRCVKNP